MKRLTVLCVVVLIQLFVPMPFLETALAIQENNNDAQPTEPSQLGSLTKVPDSAAFYFATMNHTALYEAIVESNAWKSIKNADVNRGLKKAYRRGKSRGYADYNEQNPFAQFLEAYGSAFDGFAANFAMEIAKPVFENELFIYVDENSLAAVEAFQQLQQKMLTTIGVPDVFNDDELSDEKAIELLKSISDSFGDLECPTMMMGSRLTQSSDYRGMLELAKTGIESGLQNLPADLAWMRDGWKVTDDETNYILSLNIDLKNLDWDTILADVEDIDVAIAVEDLFSTKKGCVSLGIVDNLLFFGVAKNQQVLQDFGNGKLLIDHPKLKRLRNAINKDQAVTSVFYISENYMKLANSAGDVVRSLGPIINQYAEIASDDDDLGDRTSLLKVEDSLKELADDLDKIFQRPKMGYGFTTLNSNGISGYTFQDNVPRYFESNDSFEIPTYANAQTLGFVTARPTNLNIPYEIISKWTFRFYEMSIPEIEKSLVDPAERLARQEFEDGNSEFEDEEALELHLKQQRKKIVELVGMIEGMGAELDQTTKQLLLPAIDKQETGVLIDLAKATELFGESNVQNQFVFPNATMVIGTNDSKSLISATEEYWNTMTRFRDRAMKQFADEIAKAKSEIGDSLTVDIDESWSKEPIRTESSKGTMFQQVLAQIDESNPEATLNLTTLFSERWAAMGIHKPSVIRMAEKPNTKLRVFGPARAKAPSLCLAFFDNRVLMREAKKYSGVMKAQLEKEGVKFDLTEYEAERDTLQFSEEQLADLANRCWNMAGCFKGISYRSYLGNGGTASEMLFKFNDIESEE